MVEGLFVELSGIIIIAVIVAGIMRVLKQPLIISYILTGLIVSPYLLDLIHSPEGITIFAHIGVALLLFMVGLNLNLNMLKDVGKVSLITGLSQFTLTLVVGFFISMIMGFTVVTSLYLAVGLTFSSTIIIMKLLSDKGDLETLYGRISIGFLVVQDLLAIFALMIVSAIPSGINLALVVFEIVLKGVGILLALGVFSFYALPKIVKFVAKSQEFLLLFSFGWCLALSSLFNYFNFSIEIGALLAGVTLTLTPFHFEISSRMKTLRDFFLILFFISLGSQLVVEHVQEYVWPIMVFSLFILIGNPIVVMAVMGLLGYTKKNSFLAGLTVAQISEFSLIFIGLGITIGHIQGEVLSIMTVVGLVTIFGCTYMITYSNSLYTLLSKYLGIFERPGKKVDEYHYHKNEEHDIILFGCERIAYDIIEHFKKTKDRFLVIDYDPQVIIRLAKEGFDCLYGDASDPELLNDINLSKAKMILSTVHEFDVNLMLIKTIKKLNKDVIIIVSSYQVDEAIELYEEGASYVIVPPFLGGHRTVNLIEQYGFNIKNFLEYKISHLGYLKKRREHEGNHLKGIKRMLNI